MTVFKKLSQPARKWRKEMKKMFIVLFFCIFSVTVLFSCATGTALITGTKRTATNPECVVIYTEAPPKYEVIGIVTASSDSGWTEQGDLNYAIAELKKQAAKIGANGIILENVGTSNSGGVISYGVYIPVTAKNVSGKAIYVSDNKN
ncbi:hypothetical protein [Treponema socranskii]|jgi:putative membrane protein|uniref:hypothetical protein n=1 Tax=Treponema socranskii TaxID=53419 RepID=UPI0028E1D106|nr:hypothetical protein [Treponema socranskii]